MDQPRFRVRPDEMDIMSTGRAGRKTSSDSSSPARDPAAGAKRDRQTSVCR